MDSLSWKELDTRPIPSWYQDAKFGIFIHWGPYSVPAYRPIDNSQFGSYAEWYYASVYGDYRNVGTDFHERVFGKDFAYRDFGPMFKAELYDPAYLADLFRRAGARYVVLTSKHHDGYCMWPTDNPHKLGWNAGDTGSHRDLVGDLRREVIKAGLDFGLYYSIIDWESVPSHRCDGGYFIPQKDVDRFGLGKETYFKEVLHPQLREIVTRYEPSVIFADGGEWDLTEEESGVLPFLSWLYRDSPVRDRVVVNDRFCASMPGVHGDVFSTEYRDKDVSGHPWEESRGIGKSYGYNRAERLSDYLTSKQIIAELVRIVAAGGNFLLNVGPMADGTIPVHEVERLEELGAWLAQFGEGIYGTAPAFDCDASVPATRKGDQAFLFFDGISREGTLRCAYRGVQPKEASIPGLEEQMPFTVAGDVLEIFPVRPCEVARCLERFGMVAVQLVV